MLAEKKQKGKKREEKAMRKRIFAAFVCLCMLMALVPSMAYAGDTVSVGGLCEHHTQHDDACGYSEGTTETPCTHEHTEECYTQATKCVHEHMAECYSGETTEPICGHVCSEESGCITKELNCNHEHDENCGYVPATAGTPCNFVCEICNAQVAEEPECICDTKCTEEEPNADCPVCGGENGDISGCVGAAMMLAPMGAGAITPEVPTGSGSPIDPYKISSKEELYWFANEVNGGNTGICAKLMNNITINDNVLNADGSLNGDGSGLKQWTPIGNNSNQYIGTFDGDGHTISGLYVDSNDQEVGLFGCVGKKGKIQNVGVVDSYISATGDKVCVGGVCGYNVGGTIENCYNTGTITATAQAQATGIYSSVGGVCGFSFWNIFNCYNTGKVSVTGDRAWVGGVSGFNGKDIKNCYNTGEVSVAGDRAWVGGVCGNNDSWSRITNCYNTGKVSVTGDNAVVGGVCGMNANTIKNCYFLTGTADKGTGDDTGEATEKTDSQFKSGEVAWLLNGSQNSQLWGQGSNDMPVLTSNRPKDVTCTVPVCVTIQMPDGTSEQGYTTKGNTLAEYPSQLNGKTYTFYEDSNFATPIDTATKTYEKDTVIYAKEKKNSSGGGSVFFWDLKFDTNGGSDINTVTEWEYSTIDLDEYVPEKEGYKFVGWYADEDLTKEIDEVYLTQDTTVYAKWEKIEEEVPEEPEEVEETEETETISFKDVKENDWFYEAVSYAVENGLMSGMSEDIFAPNTPLTREMLAVVLYNVEGQPEGTGVNAFTDVKADMWYTDAILWANENGIVAGYDNGAYGVGDFITREQFAAILYRYAQFKGYDTTQGGMAVREFSDYVNISDYARPAMAWAVNAGIMGGMDDGTLMPQGKATRAEAATMLMQFCEQVVK